MNDTDIADISSLHEGLLLAYSAPGLKFNSHTELSGVSEKGEAERTSAASGISLESGPGNHRFGAVDSSQVHVFASPNG